MPRLTNKLPKLRRHASGQSVVTLGGRDFYLGRHGSIAATREYERLCGEWLANGRRLPHQWAGDAVAVTVEDVVANYWTHAKRYYRKADGRGGSTPTSLHRVRVVLRDLRRLYGETAAVEFGPPQLKALRDAWIRGGMRRLDAKGNERPAAPANRETVNNYATVVRQAFDLAVEDQLIPPHVAHALAAVRSLRRGRSDAAEGSEIETVDPWIVRATLRKLPPMVAFMVRFQWRTGCRPGEACSMRWSEVDRSGDVWIYRPASHKTEHHGRGRAIYIGPKARRVLEQILRFAAPLGAAAPAYVFSPQLSEQLRLAARADARATPANQGNRRGYGDRTRAGLTRKSRKRPPRASYGSDTYARAVRRAAAVAGVDHWAPNQLRHNALTRIRARHSLDAAQVLAGHARATQTQDYAPPQIEAARRAALASG